MPLSAGARLGQYEIVSALGAGGMGEVYRARDTRLHREVALKILPETFASDPDFRTRFEREARAVAALSHPNIVQIFELGVEGQHLYAAMELLEGETLRERLPLRKPGEYALQIAHGLAAAHARGIVHRDLKPENIFITRDGQVKTLDFGLAKLVEHQPEGGVTRLASGTEPPATAAGVVLGTVGYMAPEQVRAQSVDHRTDIFAFGAVLYEMTTGRRAFSEPSAVETMHAILHEDPLDRQTSDAAMQPGLERIVRHCLEKNPDDRFQSTRDLVFALQAFSSTSAAVSAVGPRTRTKTVLWRAAVAGLALVMASALVTRQFSALPAPANPVMFSISPPSAGRLAMPAVSPDGTRVAFIAPGEAGSTGEVIWVRRLDAIQSQEIPGTGGVRGLFWSADGGSLGFFSAGKLKTIELATGRTDAISDAPSGFGGSWGADGTILFSPHERSPIHRVHAGGGEPEAVTRLDTTAGEEGHRWPQLLPDGRHFLFMSWRSATTMRPIRVGSLDGTPPRTLFEARSGALFAGDHLVFILEPPARLMAWAFDARRVELQGKPFQVVADTNVAWEWGSGDPLAAVSPAGTLAYTTGKNRRSRLTWFSRTGRELKSVGEAGTYYDPAISRDGSLLAIERHDFDRGSGDLWTADLARGTFSRLTSKPGFESVALWSPDGARLAFASDDEAAPKIYTADTNGSSGIQVLLQGRSFPTGWSPDGRYLLYMAGVGSSNLDVFAYDTELRESRPLLTSVFSEGSATFSPDGTWIAYVSDETQRRQVYVQSFLEGGRKLQVSTGGGHQPQWRGDGKELFYLAPDNTLMAVDVQATGRQVRVGTPQPLFVANVDQAKPIRNSYAPSADGQQFLLVSMIDHHVSPIVTILNWRNLR